MSQPLMGKQHSIENYHKKITLKKRVQQYYQSARERERANRGDLDEQNKKLDQTTPVNA